MLATVAQVLQAADFLGVDAVTRTCQVFLSMSQGPGTVLGVDDMAREGKAALRNGVFDSWGMEEEAGDEY